MITAIPSFPEELKESVSYAIKALESNLDDKSQGARPRNGVDEAAR